MIFRLQPGIPAILAILTCVALPARAQVPATALDSLEALLPLASAEDRPTLLWQLSQAAGPVDQAASISYAEQAVREAAAAGDSAIVGRALREAGIQHYFQGRYERALAALLRGFQASEAAGDAGTQALILNEIGTLYKRQGDLDGSLEYFEQALAVSTRAGDSLQVANSMNNMGIVYDVRGEYDRAMELFRESAGMKESIGDINGLTYNLDNMGMVSGRLGRFVEAEGYFRRAAALRQGLGDRRGYGIIMNNLGEMYALQNRWSEAREQYGIALDIARETEFTDFERHILGQLSATYESEGNYASALDLFRQQTALKDSLFNAQRSRQLIEMREQFETEQKEQTIALQEAQLAEQSAALQRNYLILGVVVMLLALLALVMVWQRSREELRIREAQTAAAIDSQERERKRIAQDLHDGLGQLLATAQIAATNTESEAGVEVPEILDDMHAEIRKVAFNLMPASLSGGGAPTALDELARRIRTTAGVEVAVQAYDLPEDLPEEVHIALYRIVQEWLSNILKHAGATRVDVQFVGHEDEVLVTVEDDGSGFDTAQLDRAQGHGWKNMLTRARRIRAHVHVDSRPSGQGSTLVVRLPLERLTLVTAAA